MDSQPISKTLPDLLAEMTARFGSCEAVIAGDDRYTYRALSQAVSHVAAGLHRLGARPGDKVAILMGNRAEWIVSAFAASSLGCVVVALNTWWTMRELGHALRHSECRFLVCPPRYLKHDYGSMLAEMRGSPGVLPALEAVIGVGDDLPAGWVAYASLAATSIDGEAQRADVSPDELAMLLYTSGSTSLPKGVQLAHRGLIENMWSIGERQHITHADRLWLAVSLFWGYGCANALMTAFTHGACIVLQESFDAAEALALIERERCSVLYGTPNMIQALAEHPDTSRRDLSSLRTGTTLGTPEQVRRAVQLGATGICNIYGMTETYGNSHVTDADDPLELRLRCSGRPLPGFSHKVVDPHTREELPPGHVGEILLKGHVTPGYYKDPEQTARCFDEDGWFKTNDLGLIDTEGRLHFRGRLKEIVKTGGINVSPAEIESVLLDHPDIQLAVVVGVPDTARDEVLGAVIVAKPGRAITEHAVVEYCKRELAAYKVPRLVSITGEASLPLTTTGKIQKNKVAETFFATAAVARAGA